MKFGISLSSLLNKEKEDSSLSATAKPFFPSEPSPFGAIFNNGVPCLTPATKKDCSDIIRGISDDAIDENFPPDATEAAELEETEKFTSELAHLSLLEDREVRHSVSIVAHHSLTLVLINPFQERSRKNPFAEMEKRWESRRSEGLRSHLRSRSPHLHMVIAPEHHLPKKPTDVTSLLPANSNLYHRNPREYSKAHTEQKGMTKHMASSKPIRYRKPIQQPRKQN